MLRRAGIVVEPDRRVDVIVGDPPDNRVLEAAAAGGAGAIVSGDRHLLALQTFDDIPIMRPRQLLDSLRR